MKAVWKCLTILGATILAIVIWRQFRMPHVAVMRLGAVRIIAPSCKPEHVHSTGMLRENTHTFRTKRSCLAGEAANPEQDMQLVPTDDPDAAFGLSLIHRRLKRAVPGIKLEEFRYFTAFDDRSFTAYWVALAKEGDVVYVVVDPF